MEKVWYRPQWNIPSWFIAHMEKAWFYERLFFEVVIVMIKIKKYIINDKISIKISFMGYMKWAIAMLPIVFEKLELVYIFFATFFFSLLFSIGKRSILAKICGGCSTPSPPGFYGPVLECDSLPVLRRWKDCNAVLDKPFALLHSKRRNWGGYSQGMMGASPCF